MTGSSNAGRLTRIESKLTRLMLGLGFDYEGNPSPDMLVIDSFTAAEIIETLDSYLNMMDNQTERWAEHDEQFRKCETLRTRLDGMRRGRWPSN